MTLGPFVLEKKMIPNSAFYVATALTGENRWTDHTRDAKPFATRKVAGERKRLIGFGEDVVVSPVLEAQ